jgi:hypothetical protein
VASPSRVCPDDRQPPGAEGGLGALAGCVQFVDAFVGFYQYDVAKTVGPLVLAVLQFYAAYALTRARG